MTPVEGATAAGSLVGVPAPNFRLPAETQLGKVVLQIADLERSLGYYTRVLGLELVARDAGTALLGAGGRAIVELQEKRGVAPVPRRGLLGLYHFAILLPDRAALGRFLTHLGDLNERAGASDHLVSEALYLQDPDGLGIEVYADRGRESWVYDASRQVAMATQPLNVESVVAAALGEHWTGAPPGTTLGHVHLHVGDIDQAAAFYHNALGFDKIVWSYPGALFVSAGGYHHHLGLNTWAAGSRPAGEGDARLLEWEIVLPTAADVDAALQSLSSAGVAVTKDGGGLVARDPWGTQLRIIFAEQEN